MKLGYAQEVITPSLDRPVYLAGFGQDRRAETVHDDLYVRVLALSDDETTLVLCALDLVGFFQNDVREVIQRVRVENPQVQVVISSTHTHHGPDTMGLWGPDDKTPGVDADYLADLKEKIVQTISNSLTLEFEVTAIKTGSIQVPWVAKNFRDPEIVDNELTVLQFLSGAHQPLATIYDFPCHPEVLWEQNPHITSDYPASLRKTVENETRSPCIFFSGALGGMMSPNVEEHSFEEAEEMGVTLAEAGLDIIQKTKEIAPRLSFVHQTFSVKLRNILFKIAIRRGLFPEPRDRRGQVTTEVNLIQIGDCWLVTVPGELLPKLGLAIKNKLRAAGASVTGVIGLANDELGYILPKEDFRYPLNPFNPKNHYEETMSISKDIGTKLMDSVDVLLKVWGE
jgi:hypothetical protein